MIHTYTYVLTFDKSEYRKKSGLVIREKGKSNLYQLTCGGSGVKNSDITKAFAEDVKCVGNVVNVIQTIQRVNAKI